MAPVLASHVEEEVPRLAFHDGYKIINYCIGFIAAEVIPTQLQQLRAMHGSEPLVLRVYVTQHARKDSRSCQTLRIYLEEGNSDWKSFSLVLVSREHCPLLYQSDPKLIGSRKTTERENKIVCVNWIL